MLIQVRKGTTTSSIEIETLDDLFTFIERNGCKAKIYKGSWTTKMSDEW
jgi:hypothetical protein